MTATTVEESLRARFIKHRTTANACFFDALVASLVPLADDPCVEMYFGYALSTNGRGRHVADILEKRVRLDGAAFLDIGCAYAGFLVAFAERGAAVRGIEISPGYIDLAKANLRDANLDVEVACRDATRLGDIIEMCNRIDVITCNDVIEHVENPLALAENIALMLTPGGVAYLEFPNRYCPQFVASDGHYGLFGITLLDYCDAKEYHAQCKPGRPYDTQYYLDLDQCTALFRRVGLTLEVIKETFDGVDLDSIRASIDQLETDADKLLTSVPAELRETVSAKLSAYLRAARSAPLRRKAERKEFALRYGPTFWRVIGRKGK